MLTLSLIPVKKSLKSVGEEPKTENIIIMLIEMINENTWVENITNLQRNEYFCC